VALPGPSPLQFFTPGSHLFLSDRTVLGLRYGDQLVKVVPLNLPGDSRGDVRPYWTG
jgi:hypothetical protein